MIKSFYELEKHYLENKTILMYYIIKSENIVTGKSAFVDSNHLFKHIKYLGNIGESQEIKYAFGKSLLMLKNVKNRDGAPYFLHCFRTAVNLINICCDCNESLIKAAILHDYLEEGLGKTKEAVNEMVLDFGLETAIGSITLTEPDIIYDDVDYPKYLQEKCALFLQIEMVKNNNYINVLISDLLDNLLAIYFDDSYYLPSETNKLINRIACFNFAIEKFHSNINKNLLNVFSESIEALCNQYNVNDLDIQIYLEKYQSCYNKNKNNFYNRIKQMNIELLNLQEDNFEKI